MSSSKQPKQTPRCRQMWKLPLLSAAGLLGLYSSLALAAGFATNFQPDVPGTAWGDPFSGYCDFGKCRSYIGNGDPTPFGLMVVQVNGQYYFHTIVGDPATGFAMESYTRASNLSSSNDVPGLGGAFSPDGGGLERSVIGNTGLATDLGFFQNSLNFSNTFGDTRVSGTGSMDPTKTVFRMVLTDVAGGMSMEVSKPFLDKKPRISQTVQDGSMTSVFVTDQRALSYSDSSTPAPVVNNLVINDPKLPNAGAADFEMALAQNPDITSGRFTFTPGTGWDNAAHDPTLGWDSTDSTFGQGTYSYVGGQAFDPLTFNWASVFNYAENALGCTAAIPAQPQSVVRETVGIYSGSCPNKP